MKKSFYITTPIYYPTGNPHIGHCYTTLACDAIARMKRMQGFDVMFSTGTDEHGQKVEKSALAAGLSPKEYVDGIVANFKKLWGTMNISYDRYIRTTDKYHCESIQKIFKQLYDKDLIYKSVYAGKYCTPCESFWTDSQLKNGKCPDCERDVHDAKEEAYFFRLSSFSDRLEKLLTETDFLQPQSRVNEMVNNFIKPGLEDICVSRTSFKWGIPVSFDSEHIVYVWVDALCNYITLLGYGNSEYDDFERFWPADIHMMAKEIVRFHSIIWPALIMALDLPLPKKIYGHGWITFNGAKMGKSVGNVIDPFILVERYGVDSVRYHLLREMPFGSDCAFSNEIMINRINSDLANDLGNLVSRTVAMCDKYFDGTISASRVRLQQDEELLQMVLNLKQKVEEGYEGGRFSNALADIFSVISRANKYIDETTPWILARDESSKPRLADVLYNLLDTIRVCSILLSPVMPNSVSEIWEQIGADADVVTWQAAGEVGLLPNGVKVKKGRVLFPRLDINEEIDALNAILEKDSKPEDASIEELAPEISIDDFFKSDLRIARVLECEPVKKSDKLLCLQLDDGMGGRQVVSGIAQYYKPEDLIGKNVLLVANLKAIKLRGVESRGMICACDLPDGSCKVIFPDNSLPAGARLH